MRPDHVRLSVLAETPAITGLGVSCGLGARVVMLKQRGFATLVLATVLAPVAANPAAADPKQILIYFGSGMGNGNAHYRNNPSVLLMGGANGRLKGDRHIVVEDKQPTANLLLGMAELANAEVEQIGHSTGRLSL